MHAPHILLIKADDNTHRGLRDSLERRGCEVYEAATQLEAVRLAGEVEADLVIQENPVRFPAPAGAFDETIEAVELLAGPLPAAAPQAEVHAGTAGPRSPVSVPLAGCRLLPRAFHARALLTGAR